MPLRPIRDERQFFRGTTRDSHKHARTRIPITEDIRRRISPPKLPGEPSGRFQVGLQPVTDSLLGNTIPLFSRSQFLPQGVYTTKSVEMQVGKLYNGSQA